ncbi:MAG: hypothetical protein RMM29_00545 [Planctomycetota bacterium]|nr:hypothetical protein [Planctomycetota bacterium]MCX8039391.1 hypothetical protein [Planctomycetota bacterium]MDW8372124.1 hypothetical protein [Planctomycetota bacterium]
MQRLVCSLCLATSLAAGDGISSQSQVDLAAWLAETPPFVQLRLGVGSVPKPAEYAVEVANTQPVQRYTDRVDGSRATELAYSIVGGRLSPWGMLYGGELTYAWSDDTIERRTTGTTTQVPAPGRAASLQYQTVGVHALCGVGLRVRPRVHLELLGLLGVGAVDQHFADAALDRHDSGSGWYWTFGVRGGAYWTWRRLVLGVQVTGQRLDYEDVEAGLSASRVRWSDSESGVSARFELGYHIPL